MFDACINLYSEQFSEDPWGVVTRGFEAGVTGMALTGSCLESSTLAINLAQRNTDRLCATVGLHPHSANRFTPELLESMRVLIQNPIVRAVGECGLDHFRNLSTPEEQRTCFKAHLNLAREVDKPLFLHQRDAFEEFIEILETHAPDVPTVVHCFTDGPNELKRLLDRGYFIGITGWIADTRRNQSLLEALPQLPLEKLLIETDAPWLTPRNVPKFRKIKANEPKYLPFVAQAIADATGHSVESIVEHSTQNARQFFGW